ncbi:MAG TPA: hypothetical protein VNG29_00610 [Candidatus Paceibacterota bacterium]|nr:hypothetical protein [Candidatus Paceibacterota bacterium]
MIYSYKGKTVGVKNTNTAAIRSEANWVWSGRIGASYIGRKIENTEARKTKKVFAYVPAYGA